jgi:hypothetical protein
MRILGRQVSTPIVFLVLGLIAGVLVGFVTVPVERSELRLGPLAIETQGNKPSVGDKLTDKQTQYVLIVALIGGILGLACGFVLQRSTRL